MMMRMMRVILILSHQHATRARRSVAPSEKFLCLGFFVAIAAALQLFHRLG